MYNTLKKLCIGFALMLSIAYGLVFHTAAFLVVAIGLGAVLLAYAIGDVLLAEYYMRK